MTKKGEKSAVLFCQKRHICQFSDFPGTSRGRAILKHILEIKILVYLQNFRCYIRQIYITSSKDNTVLKGH